MSKPIAAAELETVGTQILMAAGAPEAHAALVSENLVFADLRGTGTHGLIRLAFYVDRIEAGGLDPAAPTVEICSDAAVAMLDGGNGFGAVTGAAAMDLAVSKASDFGVGYVVARNTNHYGAAGFYSLRAAAKGCVGVAMTNVCASMAPTGGTTPIVGNNPIAIAVPGGDAPAVVWDIATSVSSWGALMVAQQQGHELPPDAFLDALGQPSQNPSDVLAGGSLVPIAGYKGYGLALSIALLTGVLADGPTDPDVPHPYRHLGLPGANSVAMLAIDVDRFGGPGRVARRVDALVGEVHTVPPAGDRPVLLPGQREHEVSAARSVDGIPLADETRNAIRDLGQRYGVELPPSLG